MTGNGSGPGQHLDPEDVLAVAEQAEREGVITQLENTEPDENNERSYRFVIPKMKIDMIDKGNYTFDQTHMAAFLTGCMARKEAE